MLNKVKSAVFFYTILPVLNRFSEEQIMDCPMCGELLQKYEKNGYLHLADGDRDCYGALGKGK